MTSKEYEQIVRIEVNNGYTVLRVIDVEGYKCAVIAEHQNYVEVVPFDENKIYPRQYAVLEWNFLREQSVKDE
jgi:hypothetical protein